jgi:hypothetical protein
MVRSALLLASLFATIAIAVPVPEDSPELLPDLIASDIRIADGMIILEVQNQGPGVFKKGTTTKVQIQTRHNNKPVSAEITIPVPSGVFEVSETRIPAANFGTNNPAELGPIFSVVLDPEKKLVEARPRNNEYHKQIDGVTPARTDHRNPQGLPDLVITDITADNINLCVHYKNQGKGVTGADFLVQIKCGNQSFDGNYFYRFTVPPPGQEVKTGGFNHNLIGLKPGDEAEVTAIIDWEDRVRETDKKNNTFTKTVKIPAKP